MPDLADRVPPAAADPDPTGPRMRAGDADRYATVARLQDGVSRGLLTPVEGGERMTAAFAAVHLADLEPLTADLPKTVARRTPADWRPRLEMVLERLQSSLRSAITGRQRAAQLGAALLLAFLLITCGLTFVHVILDNGADSGHGGYGRR